MGYYFNVALLLYPALFLSTVLFNSQTWSNLRKKDYDQLKRLQSKFIKRIVGVSYSTCTAFTFLELGILPIECEIHIRQLCYLHRILNLDETDPVHEMWRNMKVFHECGETNWWTGVSKLLDRYGLNINLDEVKEMSKARFKELVKMKVRQCAFNDLKTECQSKKKTGNMTYSELKLQPYFTKMFPGDSKTLFQCRSGTLDIKDHRTYKYKDRMCRGCGKQEETLDHILNCNMENGEYEEKLCMDFNNSSEWEDLTVLRCVQRIKAFLAEIDG